MLTLGMLCSGVVDWLLTRTVGPAAWRWMVGLPAVPGQHSTSHTVALTLDSHLQLMPSSVDVPKRMHLETLSCQMCTRWFHLTGFLGVVRDIDHHAGTLAQSSYSGLDV